MLILPSAWQARYTFDPPTDKQGNPATIDVTWALSPEGIATLEVAPDGLSALVKDNPESGLGVVTLTATAVDSIGEVMTDTDDIEIVAGDATSFNIVAGTPEPIPDAPPEEPPPA